MLRRGVSEIASLVARSTARHRTFGWHATKRIARRKEKSFSLMSVVVAGSE